MQPNQTETQAVQQTEGGGTVASSALVADIKRVNEWACCGEPESRVRAEHAAKQLHAELRRTKWALEYCLRTLKHETNDLQ